MGGAGWFFLILLLIVLVYAGWLGWKIFNARKRGEKLVGWQAYVPFMKTAGGSSTNYPTPRSLGPIEWIKDKIEGMRNKRSQTGGYEDTRGDTGPYQGLNPGGARGRTRGMDDDPWDSRVDGRDDDPYGPGPGGYHEEAELGLAPTPGLSAGYGHGSDYISQTTSYGGGGQGSSSRGRDELDPFADSNQAPSLRSVSPRPDLGLNTKGHKKQDSEAGNTSPISTRKSLFREDIS